MVTTKSDSEKFYKMVDELESKKGPNDLEEQIRILTFRNETLHKQNEKQTQEIIELTDSDAELSAEQLSTEDTIHEQDQIDIKHSKIPQDKKRVIQNLYEAAASVSYVVGLTSEEQEMMEPSTRKVSFNAGVYAKVY